MREGEKLEASEGGVILIGIRDGVRAGKYGDDKVRQSARRVGVGTAVGIEMALRIRFLLSSADRAFSLWLKIKCIHVTCYRLWVYVAQPVVYPSGKSFFVCRHSFPWIEQEPISCAGRGGEEELATFHDRRDRKTEKRRQSARLHSVLLLFFPMFRPKPRRPIMANKGLSHLVVKPIQL